MNLEYSLLQIGEEKEIEKIENICFSHPWSEKDILDSLNFDTVFFVAKYEKAVVGYVGMQKAFPTGYITNVAVLPGYRKMGIAYGLLAHLKAFSQENKIEEISLEVRASNIPAQNLYKKSGYEIVGTRKNFYRTPTEDAYIMTLKI